MKKEKFTYEKSGVNIMLLTILLNLYPQYHQIIKAKKSLITLVALAQ